MKTKFIKKSKKGFSLVEVLLAVILLAIIATPLLQTIVASIRVNNKSKEQMAANDCCTAVLEYIETLDFSDDASHGLKKKIDNKSFSVPNIYSGSTNGADSAALSYSGFTSDIFSESRLNSDASRDSKVMIYAPSINTFVMSNVEYSKYRFDVTVRISENPAISGGSFSVYDVYVKAYPVKVINGVSTHGSTPYITDYCGSIFNKFK